MPTLINLATSASAAVDEVIGYESERPVEATEHPVIGSPVGDFTVKPARTRRGRFELLCKTRAGGVALEQFLSQGRGPFRLTEATMTATTFVVTGRVLLRYEGARTAIVTVEWTAVSWP